MCNAHHYLQNTMSAIKPSQVQCKVIWCINYFLVKSSVLSFMVAKSSIVKCSLIHQRMTPKSAWTLFTAPPVQCKTCHHCYVQCTSLHRTRLHCYVHHFTLQVCTVMCITALLTNALHITTVDFTVSWWSGPGKYISLHIKEEGERRGGGWRQRLLCVC